MNNRIVGICLSLMLMFVSSLVLAETIEMDGLKIIVSYSKANSSKSEKMAVDIPVIPGSAFHFWTDNLKTEVIYNRSDESSLAPKIAELKFNIFEGSNLLSSPEMKVVANKESTLTVEGDDYKLEITVFFQ